jgi:riboflavin synthase
MKRAIFPATVYFLALFALGFVLGTIRMIIVAPRIGVLAATFAEVPVMLAAAYFASRWTIRRWHVPHNSTIRWAMVLWFLMLLFLFETVLGALLFGRTMAEQWAALATPAGLLGLSAQTIAALLPVFVGKGDATDSERMKAFIGHGCQ